MNGRFLANPSYLGIARVSLFPSLSQTEGFAHLNTAQKLVVEIAMKNDEGKQAGHRTILVDTDALSTVQDAFMWTSAGKVNSVLHWIFTTAIYIYFFIFLSFSSLSKVKKHWQSFISLSFLVSRGSRQF